MTDRSPTELAIESLNSGQGNVLYYVQLGANARLLYHYCKASASVGMRLLEDSEEIRLQIVIAKLSDLGLERARLGDVESLTELVKKGANYDLILSKILAENGGIDRRLIELDIGIGYKPFYHSAKINYIGLLPKLSQSSVSKDEWNKIVRAALKRNHTHFLSIAYRYRSLDQEIIHRLGPKLKYGPALIAILDSCIPRESLPDDLLKYLVKSSGEAVVIFLVKNFRNQVLKIRLRKGEIGRARSLLLYRLLFGQ